jgi:signal transduction histidine kinase/ligand-binding sensor domain-containing protein
MIDFVRASRHVLRSVALGLALIAFAVAPVWAVDPLELISQYGHTAWRMQDGYVPSPSMLTQTTDGYIWVGTSAGLMRFDGVRFTVWTPPSGQNFPSLRFGPLLGSRDGSLWIGTTRGLSRLKDGELFNYDVEHVGYGVPAIIEDSAGTIWFTRYRISDSRGPLCRVAGKAIECFGKKDGIDARYGLGLTKDRDGSIWFGSTMLWRWTPESSSVYLEEELRSGGGNGVIDVVADPDGSVWAALDGIGPHLGVRHYTNGRWASYVVPGFNGAAVRSHTLFLDRHNTLWVGTESDGVYHIRDGVADHYGVADGLSGGSISSIYEDKEGNIWVVTESGIDVFRDTPVVRISPRQGLSAADTRSIVALRDGNVWIANEGAVDVIRPGALSAGTRLADLPGQDAGGMFEDRAGRVWIGIDDDRLMVYENGRFVEVKRPDGRSIEGATYAFTQDVDGDIWVSAAKAGKPSLLRIRDLTVQEEVPLDGAFRRAPSLAPDREAGVWLGGEKLAHYRNGQMQTIELETKEVARTYGLSVDADGAVWASTERGLLRWSNGTLSRMDSRNGLPCSSIFSVLDDNQGFLWLYAQCGLLRIAHNDIAAWSKLPENKLPVKTFDALDGALPSLGAVRHPRVARSTDGRLWFLSGRFVHVIDPARIHTNTIPPPVHIEEVIADRKSFGTDRPFDLPPLRGELEINYTALSLSVPRKVNFRYKLEGQDADWQWAGPRRQAFYNDLRPGKYRFRVIASNGDRVWNETGATLDFSIAAMWYQTASFRLLLLAATVALIWALYRLRIFQLSRAMSARFDERLKERLYLAGEFHDTVLQTLQGSKMVADSALCRSHDHVRMHRSMEQLSVWLAQAIEEARAALHALRTSTIQTNDLAAALQRALTSDWMPASMMVRCSVVGETRDMHPIVRDEVYRIGYEAIRNASVHSLATRLDVELKYDRDLTLRVVDNGVGIDPSVAESGKAGHFGLEGMRERVTRIGGKLTIVSSPITGTAVELVVDGHTIFRTPNRVRSALFAKLNIFRRLSGQT